MGPAMGRNAEEQQTNRRVRVRQTQRSSVIYMKTIIQSSVNRILTGSSGWTDVIILASNSGM